MSDKKEKQKNKAMVQAFGSGKAPFQPTNPLSERRPTRAGGVRRRGESRDQMRQRLGAYGTPVGSDNSDIDAIFRGIQSTRGPLRRNMDGTIEDPNKPQGLDALFAKNPHLRGAADRQVQYDAQAKANSQNDLLSAIAERRAMQEMESQNPNLVTGNDGYRTIFDRTGKVIGTTAPVASNTMWSKDNAINRGTASGAEQRDFSSALQQAGMKSVSSAPKNLDRVFPGKSSPPGGASGAGVGAPQASGEPGGETSFGQMPGFSSTGMVPNWNKLLGYGPDAGPKLPGMPPNAGPQELVGPQLQYSSPNQLQALQRLNSLFPNQSSFSAGLESSFTDMFPDVKDWDYLAQLFPGIIQPGAGAARHFNRLQELYKSPAYRSQFR